MRKKKKLAMFLSVFLAAGICTADAEEQEDFPDFIRMVCEGIQMRQKTAGETLAEFDGAAFEEDVMDAYDKIAEAEWEILRNCQETRVQSDDIPEAEQTNRKYLVQAYLKGVHQQAEALEIANGDSELFWREWEEGYRQRGYALVEMKELYTGVFPAVDSIPETVMQEMKDHAAGVSCTQNEDPCYIVQALAECEIDGKIGFGTRSALKEFQEKNGLPLNGVINEAMVYDMLETLISQGNQDILENTARRLETEGKQEMLESYYTAWFHKMSGEKENGER